MKYINLLIFLFFGIILFNSCNNQTDKKTIKKGYVIKGNITGFTDSTMVFLINKDLHKKIDSTYFINNKFEFKGNLPDKEPADFIVAIKSNHNFYQTALFISNDTVILKGKKEDFPNKIQIVGSKTQDGVNKLKKITQKYQFLRDSLAQSYFKMDSKQQGKYGKKIWDSISKIDNKITEITKDYIVKNLNTFNALRYLYYYKEKFSKDSLRSMFNKINPNLKKSKYGLALSTYLENKIIEENETFSDFSAYNQNEEKVNFSTYLKEGKYILLDFTETNCGPCVKANKELKEIDNKYKDSIIIISFCVDKSKELWKKGLKRDKLNWQNLWDGNGRYSKTYIKYGIKSTPTFFIINPKGIVIKKFTGYRKNRIIEILKKEKIIE